MLRKRPPVSVSSSLQTFDIWSGLAQIWCYITGGVWKDSDPDSSGSSNGEVREPGCDYSGSSDQLGSNPPQLPEDIYVDDSGDIYTTVGDGSGGGVGWGPPPCPPGSVIVNSANKNHVNNMPLPPGGGGCPTAPDGSAWLPYSVFGSNTFAASLVQTLNITDSRKEMFLILNKDIAYELYIFLQQKGDSPDIENQLNWSIDYLMANPSVSIDVFKNQFLSIPEGYDDTFDPDFWNDPNLSYAAQILPSYADFKNVYPGHNDPLYNSPSKIYNAVGGVPLSIYNNSIYELNTCALRLSRALNYSGVVIPNIPRKTYKGADNKYYFLGASNMLAWMKKTFGTPTGADHITQSQGGENGKTSLLYSKIKKEFMPWSPLTVVLPASVLLDTWI